jgi:uncharacterized protein (TIGR03083 family)
MTFAEPIINLLKKEWVIIYDLLNGLDSIQFDLQSECPGWTIKDLLSHIIGTELMLLGNPDPRISNYRFPPHVKNPIGEFNEYSVEKRRNTNPAIVLAEFKEVTEKRVDQLRSFTKQDFDKVGFSPIGDAPYRDFMYIRLMDCYVHEQDMRYVLNKPGNSDSEIAQICFKKMVDQLPKVVAKKAGASEKSIVKFELRDPNIDTYYVTVIDGRGVFTEPSQVCSATVTLKRQDFLRLCCGRTKFSDDLALQTSGDSALINAIGQNLNFMF